jgi:nucleoside-diphosphate-sugar epimerase
MNLLEACRAMNQNARIVYTSTRQVYGIPRAVPVREDHPTLPIDVNGIIKLAAEYYHVLYDRAYDVRSAVLRLTNTYGPRQALRSDDRQGFISVLLRRALLGDPLAIFGNGRQLRDFGYVDDVVEALLLAAQTESCYGRPLNLGSDSHHSILEFVDILNTLCPLRYELVPFPADNKIIDIGDYYGDCSAFAAATGWKPQVSLAEGLRRTLAFYREHESYWR